MKHFTHFKAWFTMLVLLITGVGSAWAATYVVDFENATNTYSDWVFTNMTSQQNSITAHGGSYHGTTGGQTASLKTKNKIARPQSITFYVSKSTNNTTASNWTVQVSSDGSSWTTLKTQSATSMNKGEWTEVSQNLSAYKDVYVQINYGSSTAVRCIDDVTLTEVGLSSIAINTPPTITCYYLDDEVGYRKPNLTGLSLTLEYENGDVETIKYKNGLGITSDPDNNYEYSKEGNYDITIKYGGKEVKLPVSVVAGARPTNTVTFYANGDKYYTKDIKAYENISFPTSNPTLTGKTFVGWTKTPINNSSDKAPEIANTSNVSNEKMGTSDVNYYAVFATKIETARDYSFVINVTDFNKTSYVDNDGDHTVTATSSDGIHTQEVSYISKDVYQVSNKLQYKKNTGCIYNKTSLGTLKSVSVEGKTNLNIYYGATQQPTSATTIQGGFFNIKASSSTGNSTKITVTYSAVDVTYSDYLTSTTATELSQITVKTAPTKTEYTEGESFDATGLVITATYDNGNSEDVAYAGNETKFEFDPSGVLSPETSSVEITYGGKSTNLSISVAELPTYTIAYMVNGQNTDPQTIKQGVSLVFPDVSDICDQKFMGWINYEIASARDYAPTYVTTTGVKATENVTYYAVFASLGQTPGNTFTCIPASELNDGMTIAVTTANNNSSVNILNTDFGNATVSKSNDAIVVEDASQKWRLVAANGGWKLYNGDATLGFENAPTEANKNTTASLVESNNIWTISEHTPANKTVMIYQGTSYIDYYGEKWPMFYNTKGNGSSSVELRLYKAEMTEGYTNYCTSFETVNSITLVAFDGSDYYATFSNPRAVQFTDATAYTVSIEDNKLTLNEVADNKVPANTGVVVKTSGTNASYDYIASVAALENNLLKPASEKMTDDDYKFYKLAYGDWTNKTGLGFYWGAAEGGTFTCKAGTAYLAVPVSAGASEIRGFSLDDLENGNETAIPEIDPTGEVPLIIYTMTGIRIPKVVEDGLYIVNGKTKWMIAE